MNTFKNFVNGITELIGGAISNLLLTAMVAAFLYTVVNFILKRSKGSAGDGIKEAKSQLGWSIIALFVAFSVWGIINFLQDGIFGVGGNKTQITPPSVRVNTTNSQNQITSTEGGNTNYSNEGRRSATPKKPAGLTCQLNSDCQSDSCLKNRDGVFICM